MDNTLPGPSGRTPLRDHTYARPANAASFGDYGGYQEIGDVVLAENERIVCIERLTTQTIEQPIVVNEERLQEKTIAVPKPVQRTTTTERPVIQPLRKTIQIIREVCAVLLPAVPCESRLHSAKARGRRWVTRVLKMQLITRCQWKGSLRSPTPGRYTSKESSSRSPNVF